LQRVPAEGFVQRVGFGGFGLGRLDFGGGLDAEGLELARE
jgi:hypothetical protein